MNTSAAHAPRRSAEVRPSDYALALTLLSVGWLPYVNAFLNFDYMQELMEMNWEFDFLSLEDSWLVLCAGGFLATLAFVAVRLRARPAFAALVAVVALVGLGLDGLQAIMLNHPLTRSVQGHALDLPAYWTRGGGMLAVILTTLPLVLLYLALLARERIVNVASPTGRRTFDARSNAG